MQTNNKFWKLFKIYTKNPITVVVANAEEVATIQCVIEAVKRKLCTFILIGNKKNIEKLFYSLGYSSFIQKVRIVHEEENYAKLAIHHTKKEENSLLMKGDISTKELLSSVLEKSASLRTDSLLSHVAIFQIPNRKKLVVLTDAAVNIKPNLNEKIQIIQNAVSVTKAIGIRKPKVAMIAPVDVINENIPSTLDAAKITRLNIQGKIKNCIIGGPISFDNAISSTANLNLNNNCLINGASDILVVPTIEVGNALYKSFTFLLMQL